jgi:pathogenesis-related protein 1
MTRCALRFAAAIAIAVAGGCAAVACAAGAGLTADQTEEMLQAHNAWRRMVNVRPLHWSADLARRAQAHAEYLASGGCRVEHSRLLRDIGENLFAINIGDMVPAEIVNSWAAEGAYYDREGNRCASGKRCGHYTQIVWQGTTEVGCGVAPCATRGQVWACNYRPGGNVEGQRPY